MEIKNKKNHLSHIFIFFIMLLFVIGLTMNTLFCSNYSSYELLDKTPVIETRSISEYIVPDKDGNNTSNFKASYLIDNNSRTETITKNSYSLSILTAIPKGFTLLIFLIIVFLFYFSTSFIFLPDEWTLINRKVRLDD